jgi:hypothetical protein
MKQRSVTMPWQKGLVGVGSYTESFFEELMFGPKFQK